ncbi:hypothetical protein [Actinomadura sp. 9N215]|uniref:hypothetical protein n=1 Tax=Actinomadura sp. 9N215 TaxID=3375150 RepID=UPI0037A98696
MLEQSQATCIWRQNHAAAVPGQGHDQRSVPTLYDADETYNGKEVYVIQGWKVADAETLAQLDMPEHETAIIEPKGLMKHLPKATDGADTDQP